MFLRVKKSKGGNVKTGKGLRGKRWGGEKLAVCASPMNEEQNRPAVADNPIGHGSSSG